MKLPPMKLGVVGQPSSGKDTVSSYLVNKYEFIHFSCGDFIRRYVMENNLGEPTRPLLREVGNFLRSKYGPNYFMTNALSMKASHLVVSGIRNLSDAETLKQAAGKIIYIDVPLEKRYKLAISRGRIGDQLTMEEFESQQLAEQTGNDPHVQNVGAVIKLADYTITNDKDLENLHIEIDQLLQKITVETS